MAVGVYDRIRKEMCPRRKETGRKLSPLIKGWIYILLELVWTEGDITVSLSGHENPLRTDGYLAEEWAASVYYQQLLTHAAYAHRSPEELPLCRTVCAVMWIQRSS